MPDGIASWRRRPDALPRVLGHRGAHGSAPENTLEAFDIAMDQGAEGVELDVRLSLDGIVIVLHDRDLDRVTGGQFRARAEQSSFAELSSYDLGGGARLPALADVLEWRSRRGAVLNVELKRDVADRGALVRAVVRTLTAARVMPSEVLLSSFDPSIVKRLARDLRGFPVGYLLDGSWPTWPPPRAFARLGASGIHPHESLVTSRFLAPLVRSHALINVYGVNEEARANELSRLGVDTLITDVPGRVLEALDGR